MSNRNDNTQHIENQFIFESGSINTIIKGGTFNGPVYTCPADAGTKPSGAVLEEDMQMMLDELMEARNADGSFLLANQKQWFAVQRVLSEHCNYPDKMSDFCRTMKRMKMDEARVPCSYSSLKDASKGLPLLACKTTLWQQYRDKSDAYKKQCEVAAFLLNKLCA